MAVCLNALLSVILISVLLKMDAAHLLNQTSGGFDLQGMGNIADFRTRLESLNTPQAEELDAV